MVIGKADILFSNGTSFPNDPEVGSIFYRTDITAWYGYNGTTWDKLNLAASSISLAELSDTDLSDPGADRIVFWDESDDQFEFLVPGDHIGISGNNLNVNLSGIALNDLVNTDLSDPGADRIVFWDESDDQFEFLQLGSGLSFSGNTLNTTGYRTSFTDPDLAAGVLTVNHSLGKDHPLVAVYDNNSDQIQPDDITYTDSNNIDIDLTSYGTLSGTWYVSVIGV